LNSRQLELEKLAKEKGRERVRRHVERRIEKGAMADTPGGIALT
jgi:hypothetical protein